MHDIHVAVHWHVFEVTFAGQDSNTSELLHLSGDSVDWPQHDTNTVPRTIAHCHIMVGGTEIVYRVVAQLMCEHDDTLNEMPV